MVDHQRILRVMGFAPWALVGLLPLAAWITWDDWHHRIIRNGTVLVCALVFVLLAVLTLPAAEMAVRLAAGAVAAGLCAGLWHLGRMGGGDVKLAAALVPFVAPDHWAFAFVTLIILCAGLAVAAAKMQAGRPLPFGIPLAWAVWAAQLAAL